MEVTRNVELALRLIGGRDRRAMLSAPMDKTYVCDELRQVERDVVQRERQLAEQEKLVVEMKREGKDTVAAEAELEALRKSQRVHDQDRQRLLSLLKP